MALGADWRATLTILLLLFVVVPLVELFLLIEIGQRIGTLATIALIVGTGALGAALARQQGVSTLARLRAALAEGRMPAEPILEGVLILVAGAVLLTPGVLTDLAGFLCLIPACRRIALRAARRRFERGMREGTIHVTVGSGPPVGRPPEKNVTPPHTGPTNPSTQRSERR